MTDLESRSDVHDLVVDFYREIVFDDLLAPVFEEVAEVDWAAHIPRLIDYWCRVLFGEPSETGAILGPHQHVHDLAPFRGELFDRWNRLWTEAIDRRWAGPNAERARTHAARISGVLSRRLTGTSWEPPTAGDAGAPSGGAVPATALITRSRARPPSRSSRRPDRR